MEKGFVKVFVKRFCVLLAVTLLIGAAACKKNDDRENALDGDEIFVPATAVLQIENRFLYEYEYRYFHSKELGVVPGKNEIDDNVLAIATEYKAKAVLAEMNNLLPEGKELEALRVKADSYAEHLYRTENVENKAENIDDFLDMRYGVSKEEFQKIYVELCVGQLYWDKVVEDTVAPDEGEIEKYYLENMEKYKTVQLMYCFFSLTENPAKKFKEVEGLFEGVDSAEEMATFVSDYSELQGANENSGYTYSFDGSGLSVFDGFCSNETLKAGDKTLIMADDGIYAVFCEYIDDLSSEDIKTEISGILVAEKAKQKLDDDIATLKIIDN
jgi:hypothetical protein